MSAGTTPTGSVTVPRNPRTIVLGAGFAGIAAAVRLLQLGDHDFVVLERHETLGGTWRDNAYPGCRCDVPSNLYSYSFAPKSDWTSTYAERSEIWNYLESTAAQFGVLPHIAFSHRVLEASWEEDSSHWRVMTDRGGFTCRFLIGATGSLTEPRYPTIPGAASFGGTVMHSARWDASHRLDGERVAVIGTGASAVQIVPSIQPVVEHLDVFQRTPGWVLPHPVRPVRTWEKRLFRAFPPVQRLLRALSYWRRELVLVPAFTKYDGVRSALERQMIRHLRHQVSDPELRRRLTPEYQFGCKRVLPSNDFYPSLSQPNVELVTAPIERIEPDGLRTADGELHRADTIVFATGFQVTDNPMGEHIVGREDHRLSEAFVGELPAYLGTTVPFFPNFFMLTGPNTGTGHTSQVFMIESQMNYIASALGLLENGEVAEVLPSVAESFSDDLQRRLARTVWASGCSSWYLNASGRNVTMWPDYTIVFRRRTRRFDPTDYVVSRRRAPSDAALRS